MRKRLRGREGIEGYFDEDFEVEVMFEGKEGTFWRFRREVGGIGWWKVQY